MRRIHKVLLTLVALLLLFNGYQLMDRGVLDPDERRKGAEAEKLNAQIARRSVTIQELQESTNRDRAVLQTAFENLIIGMNGVRGRGGAGIQPVQDGWERVTRQIDGARKARVSLPETTGKIILESREMKTDLDRMLVLGRGDSPAIYRELNTAYDLLIKTHEDFSLMNQRLEEGFPLYEQLFEILNQFLEQDRSGTFRSRREAAEVASSRTEKLVEPLRALQEELTRLNDAAQITAAEANRAFGRAEELRTQGR